LDGQELRERLEVLTQPVGELVPVDPTCCHVEHDAFLITYVGVDLEAIQNEERLHGGMGNTLVAVDEGMALDEREAEYRGLLRQSGIQIDPAKVARGWAMADSRAARSRIPDAPPVAARSRRCSSTTSASARYRIRLAAGTTPRSS
jgi:hypothetical protein